MTSNGVSGGLSCCLKLCSSYGSPVTFHLPQQRMGDKYPDGRTIPKYESFPNPSLNLSIMNLDLLPFMHLIMYINKGRGCLKLVLILQALNLLQVMALWLRVKLTESEAFGLMETMLLLFMAQFTELAKWP